MLKNNTLVIIASGSSLTIKQAKFAQLQRQLGKCKIAAINLSYQTTQPDYVIAADGHIWDKYITDIRAQCPRAEYWCHNKHASELHSLNRFDCVNTMRGLSKEPLRVSGGANSGHMAINLAYQWGYTDIALIGFDYQHTNDKKHWHDDHKDGWANASNPEKWCDLAKPMAADLYKEGINIVNCTESTALACYKRDTLQNFFKELL